MGALSAALVLCAACAGLAASSIRLTVAQAGPGPMATTCGLTALFAACAATGVLAVREPNLESAVAVAILGACLTVGALTDAYSGFILNTVSYPAAAALFADAALAGHAEAALAGSAATSATLGLLWAVSRGRAIGLGDVKLGVCIGAALGMARGELALGTAFVVGGTYAAAALVRGASCGEAVPFAPYLALASLAVIASSRP